MQCGKSEILEKYRILLVCDTVCSSRSRPTFRMNLVLPSSGLRVIQAIIRFSFSLVFACNLLGLLLDSDDGGRMFLRNVSELLPDCMVSHLTHIYKFQCRCLTSSVEVASLNV
jgi:hypothetical protein